MRGRQAAIVASMASSSAGPSRALTWVSAAGRFLVAAALGQRQPLVGLLQVLRHAKAVLIEHGQVELAVGEPEIGRLREPLGSGGIVGAAAADAQDGQIVHGLDVALLGRAAVPIAPARGRGRCRGRARKGLQNGIAQSPVPGRRPARTIERPAADPAPRLGQQRSVPPPLPGPRDRHAWPPAAARPVRWSWAAPPSWETRSRKVEGVSFWIEAVTPRADARSLPSGGRPLPWRCR